MPRINRIIGFVSVSFILIFVAKINKMELFTAYFKTIADVEVRNSQRLPEISSEAVMVNLPSSLSQLPDWSAKTAVIPADAVVLFIEALDHVKPDEALSDAGLGRMKVWRNARSRAPGVTA